MARLRREHHRLLGNGYCTRPPELDCAFESICETCIFFQTSIEFRPTLQHPRDHAAEHDQTTASTCSTGSSPALTGKHHDRLDTDYLHNAAIRTAAGRRAPLQQNVADGRRGATKLPAVLEQDQPGGSLYVHVYLPPHRTCTSIPPAEPRNSARLENRTVASYVPG
jgi:hypothetical protein